VTWIRIDDNEADHPKIVALIDAAGYEAYYRLAKLRGYCARQKTGGIFTKTIGKELGLRPKMLSSLIAVGLVDQEGDKLSIHDWNDYNGGDAKILQAERSRRYRERHTVTEGVTDDVTEALPERDGDRDEDRDGTVTSRAGARARPLPHITPPNPPTGGNGDNHAEERPNTVSRRRSRFAAALTITGRDFFEALDRDVQNSAASYYGRVTGLRFARGSHGSAWVADPLGTDPPPKGHEASLIPRDFSGKPTADVFLQRYLERQALPV